MENQTDLGRFQDSILNLANVLWPEFIAIVAAAFIAMAIQQTLKDLFPIRRYFNGIFLRGWARRRAEVIADKTQDLDSTLVDYMKRLKVPDFDSEFEIAYLNARFEDARRTLNDNGKLVSDIAKLTTEGKIAALCSLRANQLAGQIGAAAQYVFDYPHENLTLLLLLAGDAKEDDIAAVYIGGVAMASQDGSGSSIDRDGPRLPAWFDDAKSRVQFQMQRAVDSMMISLSNRWRISLRISSMMLSLAIVLVFFALSARPDFILPNTVSEVLALLLAAIAAGYLASVLHDIVIRLQGGRGRDQ